MSETKWTWWVGSDEERYHTECATRDEAVQIARTEYDGAWITEALPAPLLRLADFFDAELFVEDAEGRAHDDHGDPDGSEVIFAFGADASGDLEETVRATINAWQDRHGLIFSGWRFNGQRNTEFIPPAPEEDRQ